MEYFRKRKEKRRKWNEECDVDWERFNNMSLADHTTDIRDRDRTKIRTIPEILALRAIELLEKNQFDIEDLKKMDAIGIIKIQTDIDNIKINVAKILAHWEDFDKEE